MCSQDSLYGNYLYKVRLLGCFELLQGLSLPLFAKYLAKQTYLANMKGCQSIVVFSQIHTHISLVISFVFWIL